MAGMQPTIARPSCIGQVSILRAAMVGQLKAQVALQEAAPLFGSPKVLGQRAHALTTYTVISNKSLYCVLSDCVLSDRICTLYAAGQQSARRTSRRRVAGSPDRCTDTCQHLVVVARHVLGGTCDLAQDHIAHPHMRAR